MTAGGSCSGGSSFEFGAAQDFYTESIPYTLNNPSPDQTSGRQSMSYSAGLSDAKGVL